MTDRSPLPNLELGRNPPTYYKPNAGSEISGGVILGVAVAAIVAVGAIWYAVSMPTLTAANPPATTTGQNTPRVQAPVINAMTPAPITAPAPQAMPMPTPDPATPTNVDPQPK